MRRLPFCPSRLFLLGVVLIRTPSDPGRLKSNISIADSNPQYSLSRGRTFSDGTRHCAAHVQGGLPGCITIKAKRRWRDEAFAMINDRIRSPDLQYLVQKNDNEEACDCFSHLAGISIDQSYWSIGHTQNIAKCRWIRQAGIWIPHARPDS